MRLPRRSTGTVRRAARRPGPRPSPLRDDASIGMPLIPGQVIDPIDLAGVLRLAGARDLDIAIARQLVCRSVADLQQARALWLPSLFLGPTWYRMDGKIQTISAGHHGGPQLVVHRRDGPSANSYPANPPGAVSLRRQVWPRFCGSPTRSSSPGPPREIWRPARPMCARRRTTRCSPRPSITSTCSSPADSSPSSARPPPTPEPSPRSPVPMQGAVWAWRRTTSGSSPSSTAEAATSRTQLGQLEVTSANLVNLLVLNPNQVLAPVEPAEVGVPAPFRRDSSRRDDRAGAAPAARAGLVARAGPGHPDAAQAGAAPSPHPQPGFQLRRRRIRRRPERLLRQFRLARRRDRQLVLGGSEPWVHRSCDRPA